MASARTIFGSLHRRKLLTSLAIFAGTGVGSFILFKKSTPYYSEQQFTSKRPAQLEVAINDWSERSRIDIGDEENRRRSTKGVWIWGDNRYGLTGGKSPVSKRPKRIPYFEGKALRDLALHEKYAAAVTENGDVIVWGYGPQRLAENPEAPAAPQPMLSLIGKDIISVACSPERFFALSKNGEIFGVSLDPKNAACTLLAPEVPLKESSADRFSSWMPWKATGNEKFTSISAGSHHLLALTSSGRAFATPITPFANEHGQLGLRRVIVDEPYVQETGVPKQTPMLLLPEAIAATKARSIEKTKRSVPPTSPHILSSEEIEKITGTEYMAQQVEKKISRAFELTAEEAQEARFPESLSEFGPFFSTTLHEIPSLHGVILDQLIAGDKHSLAKTSDGKVLGWGSNMFGQLGLGTTLAAPSIPAPTQIKFPATSLQQARPSGAYDRALGESPTCTAIFAGGDSSYFIFASTESATSNKITRYDILSCGSGAAGAIGNGTFMHRLFPGRIQLLCGLSEYNEDKNASDPIAFADVSVGRGHVAVVLDNAVDMQGRGLKTEGRYGKDVYIWGLNSESQLGIGNKSNVATPRHIGPLPPSETSQNDGGANKKKEPQDNTSNGTSPTSPSEKVSTMPHSRLQLCSGDDQRSAKRQPGLEECIVAGWGTTAVYWRVNEDE